MASGAAGIVGEGDVSGGPERPTTRSETDQLSAGGGRRRPSALSATVFTYATNLGVAAFSLVNVLIVARALGPSGRGEVAFLTTLAILSGSLATLGIEQANANLAATRGVSRRSLATNSLVLALVLGLVAIGVLATLIEAFPGIAPQTDPALRWLALASIPVVVLTAYLTLLVQADYAFGAANVAWLLPAVAQTLVNGSLAATGALTADVAVASWVVGQALAAGLLMAYVATRLAGFGRPDPALAGRSLAFGAKSHAGRVLTVGNYRLDQWLVGALAGTRELGLYSVAVAWSEMLFFLPTVLSMVQRPDLVRSSKSETVERTALVMRLALIMTAASALVLVVLAPFLCVALFGSDFSGSVDDLRILAIGAFGMVALKLLGNALTAQARPTLVTAAVAFAFVCGTSLAILLIREYGGLGAAIASTVAYTAGGVAIALLFARALGGRLRELIPNGTELRWLYAEFRSRDARRPGPPDSTEVPPG